MTAREIADALIADKAPQATRKQAIDLQAAILVALRKRNGGAVFGDGAPALAIGRQLKRGWGSFFLPGRLCPVFSLSFSSVFLCVFK
jgi:hypothetical protein